MEFNQGLADNLIQFCFVFAEKHLVKHTMAQCQQYGQLDSVQLIQEVKKKSTLKSPSRNMTNQF